MMHGQKNINLSLCPLKLPHMLLLVVIVLWSTSLTPAMELIVTARVNTMWATPKHGVLLHDAQFKFIYLFIHPTRRFSFQTLVKLVMPLKYLGWRSTAFLPQASQLVETLINSSTLKPFMFCTWLSDLTYCLMVCLRTMHEQTPRILP